jgi:predicted secreted protein
MNPVGAFVIYFLIWWCVFFAMLPIGVKSRWEGEGDGVDGADPGAPSNPNLKKKLLWTTLAALAIWVPTIALILSGVINFRD